MTEKRAEEESVKREKLRAEYLKQQKGKGFKAREMPNFPKPNSP